MRPLPRRGASPPLTPDRLQRPVRPHPRRLQAARIRITAAIDRELEWYAGNPDYLGRAFSRADLYLYHIVTELEARGMPLELALLPVVESAFEPYAYSQLQRLGPVAVHPGHRLALQPQAGLVV